MKGMPAEWPPQIARVEFHLNGGATRIALFAGGKICVNIDTESIPPELRSIGTWLTVKLTQVGLVVLGPGEPDADIEERFGYRPAQ